MISPLRLSASSMPRLLLPDAVGPTTATIGRLEGLSSGRTALEYQLHAGFFTSEKAARRLVLLMPWSSILMDNRRIDSANDGQGHVVHQRPGPGKVLHRAQH